MDSVPVAVEPKTSWSDALEVDERRLQEYLFRKQHGMLLKGAAVSMGYTLEPFPTSHADDGVVHFGDALMLRSQRTEGLLQADVAERFPVQDGASTRDAASLSTGLVLRSCLRTVYTVSRVDDCDAHAGDNELHYGQVVRIGACHDLCDSAMYLYAREEPEPPPKPPEGRAPGGPECPVFNRKDGMACLYPRAAPGTQWRVLHGALAKRAASSGQAVRIVDPVAFESLVTGGFLRSDEVIRMNHYGNEWRVFCAPCAGGEAAAEDATNMWHFCSEAWLEALARPGPPPGEATERDKGERAMKAKAAEKDMDPSEVVERDLRALDDDPHLGRYRVLARVYPLLRRAGMHSVRKARRMCFTADDERKGRISARAFEGMLTYLGIKLKDGELHQLQDLLRLRDGPEDRRHGSSDEVMYAHFFHLMEPEMAEIRVRAVKDAYLKLQASSAGGFVTVSDVTRTWNPGCYPEVQKGTMLVSEARQDFLVQWDIASADGLVPYEVFVDYYQDVSMAVESDDHFVEIVRLAWDL